MNYYINSPPPGGIVRRTPLGEGGNGYGDSIIVDVGDGSGYWTLVGNMYYDKDFSCKE